MTLRRGKIMFGDSMIRAAQIITIILSGLCSTWAEAISILLRKSPKPTQAWDFF